MHKSGVMTVGKISQRKVMTFLKTLALCHSVEAESKNGKLTYNAASPDEKALVEAAAKFGVTFEGITEDGILTLTLRSNGEKVTEKFQKILELEFDSDRKCMSVIYKELGNDGNTFIVTKGAESAILPKTERVNPRDVISTTIEHINDYASNGLRTLTIARKDLDENQLEQLLKDLKVAQESLDDRDGKVARVYSTIENDLDLLGAVGIEDHLQPFVSETLINMERAGIKVWVLTGDKKETAINISKSCGHISQEMVLLDLCGNDPQTVGNALQAAGVKQHAHAGAVFALVIDGASLASVFAYKDNLDSFRTISSDCKAVVCCRMSPLQKSEIVRMIKNMPGAPVTAAIGDGANDVSMIQEAHVGLGINGKEGKAAVRSADFAFSKFHFLQRVLLVHGHWYYYRVSILVQYFFYKNVAAMTAQLYYAFFNSYSTQTLYDSINLTLFNIVYTSIPIFVFGLLEQNISSEQLLARPELYQKIAMNKLLDLKSFLLWSLDAVYHSVVTFFFCYLYWMLHGNFSGDNVLERPGYGFTIYSTVLMVVTFKLLTKTKTL